MCECLYVLECVLEYVSESQRQRFDVVITIHESYMEPFTNMYIRACVRYSHIYMCV